VTHKFLWGVATSAFQLEGSPYADWTTWDLKFQTHPDVTHHYHLYQKDLKLLKDLGVNAYRFSLEWSRIQPEEDHWNEEALRRSQDMVRILRDEQIEPLITLHHFTHPKWFIEKYAWHETRGKDKFLTFVERVVNDLPEVRYWITFNEPLVFLLGGYLEGSMPPGICDRISFIRAYKNILEAHGTAYDIIHSLSPEAWVGVAHNMVVFSPYRRWNLLDQFLAKIAHHYYNRSLLDALANGLLQIRFPVFKKIELKLPIRGKLDFLGVNYYTRIHLRFHPFRPMGLELKHEDRDGHGLTDMGWEIHPRGMEQTLWEASKIGCPMIITENGIATRDHQKKAKFLKGHIDTLDKCLKKGLDIRGYFYWSLVDHYEWLIGFDAKFGLYSMNYDTLERKATPAASFYSYLIKKRSHFQ